ncbi:MAG: hypothetical protein LC808_27885 [Actinobacteria bacterium]|nr:hypothetical protein [Actinomycetota bacterium]
MRLIPLGRFDFSGLGSLVFVGDPFGRGVLGPKGCGIGYGAVLGLPVAPLGSEALPGGGGPDSAPAALITTHRELRASKVV